MRNWQAMLISANCIAESNERLGRNIRQANEELADRMSEISHAEIKAKDRVDISLEEYERMKHELEHYRGENAKFRAIFDSVKIPINLKIIPESIRTEYMVDRQWWCTRYRIEFDVEGEQ